MKMASTMMIVAAAFALSACEEKTDKTVDRGIDAHHVSQMKAGIWIDPQLDLFVVFLSSRLHPDGEGQVNDLIGRIGSVAAASVSAR